MSEMKWEMLRECMEKRDWEGVEMLVECVKWEEALKAVEVEE